MGIGALEVVDVQRNAGVIDEPLKELAQQIHVEVADPRPAEGHVVFQARAPGKVHHHPGKRFVEGHVGVAVAEYAALVAHRLGHGLSQDDADVFDGVVGVHVEIAVGLDNEVDTAMAGHLVQHVLEERYSGIERRMPGTVQIHGRLDACFQGLAAAGSRTVGHRWQFGSARDAQYTRAQPFSRSIRLP